MISLKTPPPSGQAVIESAMALSFMAIIVIAAFLVGLHGFATLVMKKWAEQHSICLVQNPQFICEKKTARELQTFFALRDVKLHSRVTRGIIHSEIDARLVDQSRLRVRYDLLANEFKRVSEK